MRARVSDDLREVWGQGWARSSGRGAPRSDEAGRSQH